MYKRCFRGVCALAQRAGVCFMLCVLLMTADLFAAQREHRNASCLNEDFRLHEIIDLEPKGLARARSHRDREEYEECEREILSYFACRKIPCRLDLWGSRPDVVREADAILDNSYKFWIYDRYELPVDLSWRENPARSRNWVYYLFSFEFLGILNEAYTITGDRRYLDRGGVLIIDFKNDNYDANALPSRDLSWYEHTVANRALALIDFWPLRNKVETPDSTFTRLFLDLVWRHARFLADDRNYARDSNHGIFNAAALLRISLMFPEFSEASRWCELAVQRIETQLAENVTGDGVHREYSPWYQIWVAGVLEQIGRDCREHGIRISQEASVVIERLFEGIPRFFHPDGTISLFGDSDTYPSMPLQHLALSRLPEYLYIRSGGRYGTRPEGRTSAFQEAGFFIMRSGWGEVRPLRTETCIMANLSGKANQHNHYDSMSFEFFARGRKWITDLGRWAYEHGDIRRRFIISPVAHNIIVPYTVAVRVTSVEAERYVPAGTGRESARERQSGRDSERRERERGIEPLRDVKLANLIDHVSLDDWAAVQALIDTISAVRDIGTQMSACNRLLARNPRGFVDRLKLHLAFCFGEEKGDVAAAVNYLRDIIKHGSDGNIIGVARSLMAMYRQPVEEEVPQKETAKEQEAPAAQEEHATREKSTAQEKSTELVMEEPTKREETDLFHWISRKDCDYLEGGLRYGDGYYWSRAFLFIKPYNLLIVDVVQAEEGHKAKQLFHMPSSVSVTRAGDRYLLSSSDSLHCIVEPLFKEPIVEYSVVEGEKMPQYQGWYSDTFFTMKEAPVIETTFDIDRDVTFLATLIIPTGEHDIGRFVVRFPDAVDWNVTGPEPLHFEILEPWHRTTVTYLPSSKLFGECDIEREPLIEITRRMR